MTTPPNRQPKGITAGGQFTAATHPESALLLDRNTREVILAPGDADTFQELADGVVIEALTVARSEDGDGYWISSAKAVNIQDLITDSDPLLHRENLEAWLDQNSPVIEDILTERYDASITADEGWDAVGVECLARLSSPPANSPKATSWTLRGTTLRNLQPHTNPTTAFSRLSTTGWANIVAGHR